MVYLEKIKPALGILDRDLSIANSKQIIDKYSSCFEELINFASNLLIRCENSQKEISGSPESLIHIYYHIIQLADGVHVLCSQSCFNSSMPLVRGLWESILSLMYILECDFEDRSTSWLVKYYLSLKNYFELQDITTKKGKEFEGLRSEDHYLRKIEFIESQDQVKKIIGDLNNLLSQEKYINIVNDLKLKSGKYKKWYSINSGPKSIKKLAKKMGRSMEYEIHYVQDSLKIHASDASDTINVVKGRGYLNQIRFSSIERSELIYLRATSYLIDATELLASKFRPDENVPLEISDILKRHGFIK